MNAVRCTLFRSLLLATLGLAFFVSPSAAIDILLRSNGASDFSSNPIPADFFDPGSLPFDGTVLYTGTPISPSGLGLTDTIVQRGPLSGLPGPETVPIEIVALQLHSVEPIVVTHLSAPDSFFDVFVELDGLIPNGGMQLQENPPLNGLVVDSFFDIIYRIDFVPVGGGAPIPLPESDTMHLQNGPVPFLFNPPPSYPGDPGFYPALQSFAGESGAFFLNMVPTPEPSSLALAGCGLAMVLAWGRRRRIR